MSTNYTVSHWNGKKVIIGGMDAHISQPANLLIGFHGAESTPENMLIHGAKLQVSNTVFIFPEGPASAGNERWSWWLDGPTQKESVAAFIDHSNSMIEMASQRMREKLNGADFHTSLWGFSQGAAAALVYALRGKYSIGKVASVCGFLPEMPDNPAQNTSASVLGIFGGNDDVVPSFLAEHALDEMKASGHSVTVNETPQAHEINGENLKQISAFLTFV